jgi:hypothetical protein
MLYKLFLVYNFERVIVEVKAATWGGFEFICRIVYRLFPKITRASSCLGTSKVTSVTYINSALPLLTDR